MKRAALAAVLLAACGRHRVSGPTAEERPWVAPSEDLVVATVNGVPIRRGEVAAHAKATQLAPRAALADLIDQELLAEEARRRGLTGDPEVELARKQEMVRRFVVAEYGGSTADPAAIPADSARPVYEKMKGYFDHDVVLKVWNVCTTPELARAVYDEARAHPPRSGDEFRAIGDRYQVKTDGPIFAEFENAIFDYAWRKAIFAALKKKGDLMAPVHPPDSHFPCTFVTWLEEAFPPRHDSFDQALPELREKIYQDWRRRNFVSWEAQLVRQHAVEEHPEALPQ